jgi:hypothetical protein
MGSPLTEYPSTLMNSPNMIAFYVNPSKGWVFNIYALGYFSMSRKGNLFIGYPLYSPGIVYKNAGEYSNRFS